MLGPVDVKLPIPIAFPPVGVTLVTTLLLLSYKALAYKLLVTVVNPLILTPPTTSSAATGVAVPIP